MGERSIVTPTCTSATLQGLYAPSTTSLGKTRVIVTLLWCRGLLCDALAYLVGLWPHDTLHCDSMFGICPVVLIKRFFFNQA